MVDNERVVHIEGLSVAGDGVGRLDDGRVVFVEGALPGDEVRVSLGDIRKRVQYGSVTDVIAPSADRVESLCEIEACGGCALRELSPAAQRRHKRGRVVETLRRLGGVDVDGLLGDVVSVGDGWHYRHRVRLHAAFFDDRWNLGFHARRSRTLVPLVKCPVMWPELEVVAVKTAAALASLPRDCQLQEVEIAYSRRDDRATARLQIGGDIALLRRNLGWIDKTGLSGVDVIAPAGRWRHGNLVLRYDHGACEHFDLRFEAGSFTQAFPEVNDRLVEAVLHAVRPRQNPKVLELHAGIGNFTIPMARAGAVVHAVERNRRAAVLCERNAQAPGLNIVVDAQDDIEAVATAHTYDCIVLDPPRTGAPEVVEALAKKGPHRIVYVSCDVATLARDVALLRTGGYKVTAAQAFDMFPETPHVETLLVLER